MGTMGWKGRSGSRAPTWSGSCSRADRVPNFPGFSPEGSVLLLLLVAINFCRWQFKKERTNASTFCVAGLSLHLSMPGLASMRQWCSLLTALLSLLFFLSLSLPSFSLNGLNGRFSRICCAVHWL